MAEVAPAPAAAAESAAPPKAPKKKAVRPAKRPGPGVAELVLKAVRACKDKKGISYVALRKALAAGGYDVDHNRAHLKRAIRRLVDNGVLQRTRGVGVSGSFKECKTVKKSKQETKKVAGKANRPAAKKTTADKKTAVAKKSKDNTTPKKAKKSAAKKAVKKPAAKKATKKPAAKKPAVKRAVTPKKSPKKAVSKKAAAPRSLAAKKVAPKTQGKKAGKSAKGPKAAGKKAAKK